MFKVLNFIIPFLMEMIFGKKDDKASITTLQKFKRGFVYLLMAIAFGLNWFLIGRVYNLSVNYVNLKAEKVVLMERLIISESYKAKSEQLERTLEFCMRAAFSSDNKTKKLSSISKK